jgi:hypothetical protein
MPLLKSNVKSSSASVPNGKSSLLKLQLASLQVGKGNVWTNGPKRSDAAGAGEESSLNVGPTGVFSTCANPDCGSGWIHLLRSRSGPIFEGGWNCSASCTAVRVEAAVRRELEGRRSESITHRHRVPLGLVMLEHGWISSEQLRQALEAQRATGQRRLGKWLVLEHGIPERLVTRALSMQWNCPVLGLDNHDPEAMAPVLPRLFIEAFGTLPLRVAAGQILYLGFEERLDPVVSLAIERMAGLRVEAGLVGDSLFHAAHRRLLDADFPRASLIETASEAPLVRLLSRAIEQAKPIEARLVRVHDCLWLRMWSRPQSGSIPPVNGVEDVICSLVSG